MTILLRNWLSSFAALLTLCLASAPAAAAGWGLRADATPAPRKELLWGLPRDDPAIAIGAIVLALGIFVVVAWIAARVGDRC
jgi:hypothetical protein